MMGSVACLLRLTVLLPEQRSRIKEASWLPHVFLGNLNVLDSGCPTFRSTVHASKPESGRQC